MFPTAIYYIFHINQISMRNNLRNVINCTNSLSNCRYSRPGTGPQFQCRSKHWDQSAEWMTGIVCGSTIASLTACRKNKAVRCYRFLFKNKKGKIL